MRGEVGEGEAGVDEQDWGFEQSVGWLGGSYWGGWGVGDFWSVSW